MGQRGECLVSTYLTRFGFGGLGDGDDCSVGASWVEIFVFVYLVVVMINAGSCRKSGRFGCAFYLD